MVDFTLIASVIGAVLTIITVAAVGAWYGGYLEPVTAFVVKYMFMYEAKAEEKALEAQGKKAGIDFIKGECPAPCTVALN